MKKFVLLASQRTGSNILNENINQLPGVLCHNEVFNPAFVGLSREYLALFGGEAQAKVIRDANPLRFRDALLQASKADFVGFHLFPGHLREVIEDVLVNPEIKKLCLRRSPFQSYVSLIIAQQTNVWRRNHLPGKVPDQHDYKPVKIVFNLQDYERYEHELRKYWHHIYSVMKNTDQTWLDIGYGEVNDVESINRCADYLGVEARIDTLKQTLKKINPESLADKVSNYDELEAYAKSHGLERYLFDQTLCEPQPVDFTYLMCNKVKIAYDPSAISDPLVQHINSGTYEREEAMLIGNIIQPDERILEIGGGLGYLSTLALNTGKVEALVSYEANPKLIPLIQQTWALNRQSGECRNSVITNTSSGNRIDFYLRKDFWASSLSPEPYGYEEVVKVETTNFQELLDTFKPTMIICDIEGGEGQLFEGVRLEGVKKVFMEVHQNVLGRWGMKKLFERFMHQDFHYDVWHSIGQVVMFSHVGR